MKIPATFNGEMVYIVAIDTTRAETVCIHSDGSLRFQYPDKLVVLPGKFRPVAPKKGALLIGTEEK